jgi:energy-coupling factor transport system permease protein
MLKPTANFEFHPLVILLYLISVIFLALLFNHPLFLLVLFFSIVGVSCFFGWGKACLNYLKLSGGLFFLIVLFNLFLVRTGSTVLWMGPRLPGWGKLFITWEAFVYGIGMGLRLLIMISVFCWFIFVLETDRLVQYLGMGHLKIALILGLALRLFPLMYADWLRIIEVQRTRGQELQKRKKRERIRQLLPSLKIFLLSSLERAFQLAESLQMRGYGLGKRSNYRVPKWRKEDKIMFFFMFGGVVFSLWLIVSEQALYHYYPTLQSIGKIEIGGALILGFCFLIPGLLNWGWKKWSVIK